MKILFCIDDTDNLETRGTGQLSQIVADRIVENGWGTCSGVSRHQLFVHDDIPYTSHNSAMCFEAEIGDRHLSTVIEFGKSCLEEESAEGSDPGLCVTVNDRRLNRDRLISFGRDAKKTVLTKEMAYSLAKELGIHLSEHGGTGDGVIGAVAGTGLRLSGNDGRYRGWYHFGLAGKSTTVGELCSHDFIDGVKTVSGEILDQNTRLILGDDKVKTVFQDNRPVVLVADAQAENGAPRWTTLTKQEVKRF